MDEAMTMTNASPSARQGASREEIASLLGVTVGSLKVTCSRLGISLRRKILHSGRSSHLRDPKGRAIPFQGRSVLLTRESRRPRKSLRR